ncbi:hypothetical protein Y882_07120 [Dyella japonica DSM 16301]|uniref:Uncharacterized protein n=1 Tax=Dyella japonica DSM 16301 TaxID=1440762 RepID=A0A0G9H5D6_9GAMM|nr:hypothetical protein Y882_07120 [Dyella japonica DSM 16301]
MATIAYMDIPGWSLARRHHQREQGNVMNRNRRLALAGVATWVAMGAASAHEGYAQLAFIGAVVQEACNPGAPVGAPGRVRSCGSGSSRAVYTENTATAQDATGVAMLDYFVDRHDGGHKYVVTRQYL